MKLSQQSQSLIEAAIAQAMSQYPCGCNQAIVTDIHLQPCQETGELTIFDDDEQTLATTIIEEWITYRGNNFYKDAERVLRTILTRMKDAAGFDQTALLQPYSFVLLDEEKETLAELLIMDDDLMLVNEELLKGLDEELDAFLKDLLAD